MLAGDTATVNELNARARADRVASGVVIEEGVDVAGAMTAGVNDLVVTRENNRRLDDGYELGQERRRVDRLGDARQTAQ